MPLPSVTYTFANSTTADATQVNQNFTDLINSLTDGTKSVTVAALTLNSTFTAVNNVILGNSLSNTITLNGAVASSIQFSATNSFDIGTSTNSIRSIYLASSDSSAHTVKLTAGITGTSYAMALPTAQGAANSYLKNDGSGNLSWNTSVPTVQKFTSGTAQTYTTPANVLWIRVRMVGGGGGGGAGGAGGAGGNGGDSSFGTALLTASGGTGGGAAATGASGGAGGAASLGSGPIGVALQGGSGSGTGNVDTSHYAPGAPGASSPFGGGGGGGSGPSAGSAAIANSGAGGGGGGNLSNGGGGGGGGGAGGFVDAIITSPTASYSYTVGASGAAGSASGSGAAGGAGAAGIIIVEEYYR